MRPTLGPDCFVVVTPSAKRTGFWQSTFFRNQQPLTSLLYPKTLYEYMLEVLQRKYGVCLASTECHPSLPKVFVDPTVGSGTSIEVAQEMGIESHGLDLHSGYNIMQDSILDVVGKPAESRRSIMSQVTHGVTTICVIHGLCTSTSFCVSRKKRLFPPRLT